MRRERQLPPGQPEHLSSTTRAVAWGAMFFAFLSFAISLATFFLTYKDGKLVDNFGQLVTDLKGALPHKAGAAADSSDDQEAMRSKVRDQLDRYADMIRQGNTQAKFYLDDLRVDLGRLQTYGSADAKKWIADAAKTVESARDQIRSNAPEAAQKLKDLSEQLGGAVKSVRQMQGLGSKPATDDPSKTSPPASTPADSPDRPLDRPAQ